MKKNKVLTGVVIGIAVIIIGIIAAMFATGKFNSLKSAFENETTSVIPAETTQPAFLQNPGRPKSVCPDSIVASEYNNYSETSANEISGFTEFGMNTVIFELTEDNGDKVSSLFESAKAKGLYHGIFRNFFHHHR